MTRLSPGSSGRGRASAARSRGSSPGRTSRGPQPTAATAPVLRMRQPRATGAASSDVRGRVRRAARSASPACSSSSSSITVPSASVQSARQRNGPAGTGSARLPTATGCRTASSAIVEVASIPPGEGRGPRARGRRPRDARPRPQPRLGGRLGMPTPRRAGRDEGRALGGEAPARRRRARAWARRRSRRVPCPTRWGTTPRAATAAPSTCGASAAGRPRGRSRGPRSAATGSPAAAPSRLSSSGLSSPRRGPPKSSCTWAALSHHSPSGSAAGSSGRPGLAAPLGNDVIPQPGVRDALDPELGVREERPACREGVLRLEPLVLPRPVHVVLLGTLRRGRRAGGGTPARSARSAARAARGRARATTPARTRSAALLARCAAARQVLRARCRRPRSRATGDGCARARAAGIRLESGEEAGVVARRALQPGGRLRELLPDEQPALVARREEPGRLDEATRPTPARAAPRRDGEVEQVREAARGDRPELRVGGRPVHTRERHGVAVHPQPVGQRVGGRPGGAHGLEVTEAEAAMLLVAADSARGGRRGGTRAPHSGGASTGMLRAPDPDACSTRPSPRSSSAVVAGIPSAALGRHPHEHLAGRAVGRAPPRPRGARCAGRGAAARDARSPGAGTAGEVPARPTRGAWRVTSSVRPTCGTPGGTGIDDDREHVDAGPPTGTGRRSDR